MLLGIEMPRDDDFSESEEDKELQADEEAVFMTEQINIKSNKESRKGKDDSNKSNKSQKVDSQLKDEEKLEQSESSKSGESSMEYQEFKKVAAELLGQQRNYKQAFDINTAYKALRNVVSRVRNETKQ